LKSHENHQARKSLMEVFFKMLASTV